MYKTSDDARFLAVKDRIQRAYLRLVVEKGFQRVTVTDVANRAEINRMTFYDHYETIDDVFLEFLDDEEKKIAQVFEQESPMTIDQFFSIENSLLVSDMEFYRYAATNDACTPFRRSFRDSIARVIARGKVKEIALPAFDSDIYANLIATLIAYAYFDWLAGKYGDTPLGHVVSIVKEAIRAICAK